MFTQGEALETAQSTKEEWFLFGLLCASVFLQAELCFGSVSDRAEQILEIFSGFGLFICFYISSSIFSHCGFLSWTLIIENFVTSPSVGRFENEVGHSRADDSRHLLSDRIQNKSVMAVKGNLSLPSLISRMNAPESL